MGALVAVAVALVKGGDWLAWAIPAVGIVLFLGVSLMTRLADTDTTIAEAAMRRGLAAGFFGSYLTVLGFSLTTADNARYDTSLVKNLTWVVGVVVSFYFGSTSAAEVIKKWGEK